MGEKNLAALHAFIVQAKISTYVGDGVKAISHRPKSHDLEYKSGDFSYLDSYYGGADFIGEEIVYFQENAIWAENYYGRILIPALITAEEAGRMLKASLSEMYREGRFLGGFQHALADLTYSDRSEGDHTCFTGQEWIEREGKKVYQLVYHGGLIRE